MNPHTHTLVHTGTHTHWYTHLPSVDTCQATVSVCLTFDSFGHFEHPFAVTFWPAVAAAAAAAPPLSPSLSLSPSSPLSGTAAAATLAQYCSRLCGAVNKFVGIICICLAFLSANLPRLVPCSATANYAPALFPLYLSIPLSLSR